MTHTLNEVQLAQIVGAVLKALQTQGAAPSGAAPQPKNTFGKFDPIAKDRQLLNTFSRRGFKVTLMDRNDPTTAHLGFGGFPYSANVRTLVVI